MTRSDIFPILAHQIVQGFASSWGLLAFKNFLYRSPGMTNRQWFAAMVGGDFGQ